MGADAWITLAVMGLVLGLLAATRVGPDVILCGGVTLLVTLQVLTPAEAIAGMANEGMATVALLFIVAAGSARNRRHGQCDAALTRPSSLAAPGANPVGGARDPDERLSQQYAPSRDDAAGGQRLGPPLSTFRLQAAHALSFASILGGACTLIGASTNLLINALLAKEPGAPTVRLLGSRLGGLAVRGDRLWVYDLEQPLVVARAARRYAHCRLTPGNTRLKCASNRAGPWRARRLRQAGLRHLAGLFLMEIHPRQGSAGGRVAARAAVGNDQLVFVGVVESIVDLQRQRGLVPATDQLFKLSNPRSDRCLVEAVVSSTCPLVGQSIRERPLPHRLQRRGHCRHPQRRAPPAKTRRYRLQPGDTLLLETHPWFAEQHRHSRDFYLVSSIEDSAPPRHERAWVAVGLLGLMLGAMALGWMPVLNAVMLTAGLMIMTKCCSITTARRSINWQVIIVIAAAFALARAMESSGAAAAVSQTLLGLAGDNPWAALAMVYGAAMLFTHVITNNAAAVLVFPIALETARALGVSPMPFMIALMMAASCGFATPIAYQTNLMVYGPGGYRFTDYLRFGGPLTLLVWGLTVGLTPWVWPF